MKALLHELLTKSDGEMAEVQLQLLNGAPLSGALKATSDPDAFEVLTVAADAQGNPLMVRAYVAASAIATVFIRATDVEAPQVIAPRRSGLVIPGGMGGNGAR